MAISAWSSCSASAHRFCASAIAARERWLEARSSKVTALSVTGKEWLSCLRGRRGGEGEGGRSRHPLGPKRRLGPPSRALSESWHRHRPSDPSAVCPVVRRRLRAGGAARGRLLLCAAHVPPRGGGGSPSPPCPPPRPPPSPS